MELFDRVKEWLEQDRIFYVTTSFINIQKYYQNEPRFNGVYSINNLHKIKDWEHVINLDEYKSTRVIN